MRKLKKALKYLFLIFLLLLALVVGSGYYFLNTTNGLKRAIAIANDYSGYEVSAESVKGDMFNGIVLSNFRLKDKYFDFHSKKIVLDWRVGAIWNKELTINAISVTDSTLMATAMGDQPAPAKAAPFDLQDVDFPFDIRLEDLIVENLTIKNPIASDDTSSDRVINQAKLRVHYVGQKAVIESLTFDGFDTKLNLTGEMLTRGDYPLTLKSNTSYNNSTNGQEKVDVDLTGALKKKLSLHITGKGFANFDFKGTVNELFDNPSFDSQLSIKSFDGTPVGLADTLASGDLHVTGDFAVNNLRFQAKGDVFYDSPTTDKLRLRIDSEFDGDNERSEFILDLLTARQKLTGNGRFNLSKRTLDVNVRTDAFYWPQNTAKPNFKLTNTSANITGTIDDYHIDATGNGHTEMIGDVAFQLNGDGDLHSLKHFDVDTRFNGDLLNLSGKVQWIAPLQVSLTAKADKIRKYQSLPGVDGLLINASVTPDRFSANGGFYVEAEGVPPANIKLDISGEIQASNPSQVSRVTLDKARVVTKALGGEIVAIAKGQLVPLDLNADFFSTDLKPQQFYPDIHGNINHKIHLTAKQNGDFLSISAFIESLTGQLQNYPLAGKGVIHFEQADNRLKIDDLKLDLAKNTVAVDGVWVLDGKRGQSDLVGKIDAQHLSRLLPGLSGSVNADLRAKGTLLRPELNATLQASNISYKNFKINQVDATAQADYDIAKGLLSADSVVFYDSPDTDKLQLKFRGDFDGDLGRVSQFDIDLLASKQRISGESSYRISNENIKAQLNSERFYWPQNSAAPDVIFNDLQATIAGTKDDYRLLVRSDANTLAAGTVPLDLTLNGNLKAIKRFDGKAKFNNQPFTVGGSVTWEPKLDYNLRVLSADIAPFEQFPGLKRVDMKFTGDERNYHADGDFYIYGKDIPPNDVKLSVRATSSHLEKARITTKVLGGVVKIDAQGKLSPLDLIASINGTNIQPQTFYPGIKANLNQTIQLSAKQLGGNISVAAILQKLSGTLQNHPVSGSGSVLFSQAKNQLDINNLKINLAGNRVKSQGALALDMKNGRSDLKAHIDAPLLQSLMPALKGAVKGDITMSGTLSKPKIFTNLSGVNVAYQGHSAEHLKATADINLSNKAIAINAEFSGVKTGEHYVKNATAKVNGKLDAHSLNITIKSPVKSMIPSVLLVGNGGINLGTQTWKGILKSLSLNNELLGKWRTTKVTPVILSAKDIKLGKLCLQQSPAVLCAEGRIRGDKGNIDVTIKSLSTKIIKAYLPKNIAIHTKLSGKASIALNKGRPNVTAKLSAKGGLFKIKSTNGVLTSKIRRLDTAAIIKNNRLEALVKSDFSKIGKIDITGEMPNLNKGTIKANIKINNQSLKFVESLAPQLSDVKGRLTGDMTLSGDPSKSLKVAGKITVHKIDFNVPKFGSEIRDLTLDIYAKNGSRIGFKGQASAGGGRFDINGDIDPAKRLGTVNLKGKDFQLADSNKLKLSISPDIKVILDQHIKVRGEILIPHAVISPESTGSKVTVSEDVVLPNQPKRKISKPSPIDVELNVKLGDDVRVASADIETRLLGGLKVSAKPGRATKATGAIEIEAGELRIYGQMINIERGRVIFGNGPIANPSLDIRTSREIDDGEVVVGASVLGTVKHPEISLFSMPSMGDASILSYLLFGRPPDSGSFSTTALLQTGGMIGVNSLARDLRSSIGLDVLDFRLSGVEAGKNMTKKMYVGMRSNFFEAINEFIVNYKISGRTRIESTFSAEGTAIDLIKIIETD